MYSQMYVGKSRICNIWGFQLTVFVMAWWWLFYKSKLVANRTCVNDLLGPNLELIKYIIVIYTPTEMSYIKTIVFRFFKSIQSGSQLAGCRKKPDTRICHGMYKSTEVAPSSSSSSLLISSYSSRNHPVPFMITTVSNSKYFCGSLLTSSNESLHFSKIHRIKFCPDCEVCSSISPDNRLATQSMPMSRRCTLWLNVYNLKELNEIYPRRWSQRSFRSK